MDIEPPDFVSLGRLEAIALADLLFRAMSHKQVEHGMQLQALSWALELQKRAVVPPWPTKGLGARLVLEQYEYVQRYIAERIEGLRVLVAEETAPG